MWPPEADIGAHDDHYLAAELTRLVKEDPAIFRFLEAGSLDGIWYWDLTDMDHEWMSDRFWETFGYDPQTKPPLASAWQDIVDAQDLANAVSNVERHLADPNHPYDQLIRYRHAQGHTVWVRCRGIAIRDASGRPIRMLGAHQDVTELKQAQAQLTLANKHLGEANEELRRFAYAASHDIRSPANTLDGLLQRLVERHSDALDAEGKQLLAFAQRNAKRMREMSDRVLNYSRVARAELELSRVAVHELVQDAIADLAASIEEQGAEVMVTGEVTADADGTMLRIALQNLLENALKYRSEMPVKVHVSVQQDTGGQRYRISVDDNGIGIPEDQRDGIFGAFQRLHLRTEYGGVGLGLAMVRQVVQAHGGEIHVTDSPLGGSRFILDLAVHLEESR